MDFISKVSYQHLCSYVQFVCCFSHRSRSVVLFVSGPAHVLCLNMASGGNKERCMLEIYVFTLTENRFLVIVIHLYTVIIRDVHILISF
jgi:hypothetical protein